MNQELMNLDKQLHAGGNLQQVHQHGNELLSDGNALQQVKTAYTTAVAVQKPRSITRVENSVIAEAALAGSSFYYRWPVKNKKTKKTSFVQGPSVDLAMSLARNYGNCVVDVDVKETHSHYLFKGVFVDLETGFTVPRLFRQRKSQNIGSGYGDDRAEDLLFQVGHSKAQRNAIIKAMPGWLIDRVIETARNAELNNIKPENMALTRAKILEYFEGFGVTQEQLEEKVDRKADNWTAEDVVNIKEMASALKYGHVSVRELFPKKESENNLEEKLKKTVAPKEGEQPKGSGSGPVDTPKKKEDIPPHPGEPPVNPWNYETWKAMRAGDGETTGFGAHVLKNKDTYGELDQSLKDKIVKKWETVYPLKDFPLTKAPSAEIDPEAMFECPNANGAEVNGQSCIDCNYLDGCPAHE